MLLQPCVHIMVPFPAIVLVDMVIIEDATEDIIDDIMLLVVIAPITLALVIVEVVILPVPMVDDAIDAIEVILEFDADGVMVEDCICAAGEAVIPLPEDAAE